MLPCSRFLNFYRMVRFDYNRFMMINLEIIRLEAVPDQAKYVFYRASWWSIFGGNNWLIPVYT